ncbi:apolipoprotein N-acyltransferase [Phenylobacterium immobile]|uniref:apolipoprotein N-acyltransferase n=1 Tax=Phenylobacterium immobile TaxID=21 RepID=UPI000AEB18E0|nr:apolipoprotein N-acyltransferase [Phenylobacterium immobile]
MTWLNSPWTVRALCLLAGAAAGLAHPPFGATLGLLGYALLMSRLDVAASWRSALFRGWLAGLGYFAVGVWWIVEPFMVDAKNQGWMAPFALVLMAAGLALFWGLGGLIYRLARPQGLWRAVVFAGAFAGAEWLRGHLFTGFPWNLPGETWRAGSAPSQIASLIGAYGLTWVTLALAAAPAVLFDASARRGRLIAAGVMAAALAGLYGYGEVRLAQAPEPALSAPLVRIVQANIDQKDKWRPENLDLIVRTYADLSRRPGAPKVVIWPEGALPAVLQDLTAPESPYGPRLAQAIRPDGVLLMGANRAGVRPDGRVDYFNSLVALRRAGGSVRIEAAYDKRRLVPFGEFLPTRDFATQIGLRSLVHMPEDFTAGPPPTPMALAGLAPFQPLICYEALFPGFARDAAIRGETRPAFLLNVSNDAWFGATSGPLQHLNIASYRAIEEGLPLIRATPTGVSGIIDAHGRINAALGLGDLGVIDAPLPPALPSTVYGRVGDLIFSVFLTLSLGLAAHSRLRRPAIA